MPVSGLSRTSQDSLGYKKRQIAFPRPIRRDFVDFAEDWSVVRIEEEPIDNTQQNWEVGGDYEYLFENDSRLQFLFIANEDVLDSIREHFAAPSVDP